MSSGTKCHGPLRHRAGRQARRSSQSSWWLPGDQCHPDKRRPPGGCALMGLSLPGGLWVLLAEASLPHKEPHWSLLSSLSSPEAKETWQPSQRPGSGPPPPASPPLHGLRSDKPRTSNDSEGLEGLPAAWAQDSKHPCPLGQNANGCPGPLTIRRVLL